MKANLLEGNMNNIRILQGTYKIRGKDVDLSGMVFPLVEEFKVGAKGGYVTAVSYTHLTLPTIYSV